MQDIIRIGTVSDIDRENGMICVVYQDRDDKVSQMVPCFSFNDEYKMPEIGKKVFVAHLSNGTEMAIVLGKYWNEDNKPVEPSDTYRKQFDYNGKAFIKYDEKTGELLIQAPRLKIISDEKIVSVESNVNIMEDAVISDISFKGHAHTGTHGETTPPH